MVIKAHISNIKSFNPPILIFQHLPVNEKVKNIEVYKMRNGYVIKILKIVEIREIGIFGKKNKFDFTKVFFIEKILKY